MYNFKVDNIDNVNLQLEQYSNERVRSFVVIDEIWNVVEEFEYTVNEIIEAEANIEIDYNDIIPIEELIDDGINTTNAEPYYTQEVIDLNIDSIINKQPEIEQTENKIVPVKDTIEKQKDIKEIFRELKDADSLIKFISENMSLFKNFWNWYDSTEMDLELKKKLAFLSIKTINSFLTKIYISEKFISSIERIIDGRKTLFLYASLDQKKWGKIVMNWYNELVTNKNSKFIIIENIKTWENYVVSKWYNSEINCTFWLHKESFQYFLDKISFHFEWEFNDDDFVVRWWGYIKIWSNWELILYKSSQDFWKADFMLAKKIINENFWIEVRIEK